MGNRFEDRNLPSRILGSDEGDWVVGVDLRCDQVQVPHDAMWITGPGVVFLHCSELSQRLGFDSSH